MPEGRIEENGVVVVCNYLFYGLIDRLLHQRIVLAVTELSDDQTAQMRQNTAHAQVANHSVDMIVPFTDIFDEQNRELITDSRLREAELRAL